MSDIRIKLENYKKVKNWDQIYPDARILLVTGKNEIGKTSIIRAVIENLKAQGMTDTPVTLGEQSGSVMITVPDKNGNSITINHNFNVEDKKGTFYAIDHLGKKIKDPSKIREAVGVFEELSLDKFFALMESAEGRRKIIKNFFYPLIAPDKIEEIQFIDKNTKAGGELFDNRTAVNSKIELIKAQLQTSQLTPQDNVLISEIDNINKNINALQSQKENMRALVVSKSNIETMIDTAQNSINEISFLIAEKTVETQNSIRENENEIKRLELLIENIKEKNKKIGNDSNTFINEQHEKEIKLKSDLLSYRDKLAAIPATSDLESIEQNLVVAQKFLADANNASNKNENTKQLRSNLETLYAEQDKLNNEIDSLRNKKLEIIKNSNLPKGLVLEDDSFTFNGFSFNENQISESTAALVVAEILCNIVQSRIVYIGRKSIFDESRFKQLIELAAKYNKIPVLEEVVHNQEEIKVIYEIQD